MNIVDAQAGAPVVVYDLEYTAWPGSQARDWSGPGERREIIQIGAVRLSPPPALDELAAFACLTRPRHNPALSDYIVTLTGIDQARLDREGVDFAHAQARFDDFIGDDAALALANGDDRDILLENARINDVAPSRHIKRFRGVRAAFAAALGVAERELHSHALPALVGAPFEGRPHDALSDARAIAAALRALVGDGRLQLPA